MMRALIERNLDDYAATGEVYVIRHLTSETVGGLPGRGMQRVCLKRASRTQAQQSCGATLVTGIHGRLRMCCTANSILHQSRGISRYGSRLNRNCTLLA